MTPRQKRIVDYMRKQKTREFRHDSDQEILDYLGTLKKMYPKLDFDAWMRGKRSDFR